MIDARATQASDQQQLIKKYLQTNMHTTKIAWLAIHKVCPVTCYRINQRINEAIE